MKPERKYKEPSFKVSPRTGKLLMYVLFVFRIVLIAVCLWGLYRVFIAK